MTKPPSDSDAARLLPAMRQYGYSLLEPGRRVDPNELLAAVSRSEDLRVVEGFPVVLANALKHCRAAVNLAQAEKLLKDEPAREGFRRLAALSYHLFDLFGVEGLKPPRRPRGERAELLQEVRRCVERDQAMELGGRALDVARVKKTFLLCFVRGKAAEGAEDKTQSREDFRREYYLALFFAPKQRELLQKKLRGEPLNKTEREYFSRVVKKKLSALADPDLHRLAQKALQ